MTPTLKPPLLVPPGLALPSASVVAAPDVTAVDNSGQSETPTTTSDADRFALDPQESRGTDWHPGIPGAGRFATDVHPAAMPARMRPDMRAFFTFSTLENLAQDDTAQIHQSWTLGQNELSLSLPRSHVSVATTEAAVAFLQQLLGGDFTLAELLAAFDPLLPEIKMKLNFAATLDEYQEAVWQFSAVYYFQGDSCGSLKRALRPTSQQDGLTSAGGRVDVDKITAWNQKIVPYGFGRKIFSQALTFLYAQSNVLSYSIDAQEVGTYAWRLSPLPFSTEQAALIVEELKAFNEEHALALTDAQTEAVRSPYDVTQLLVLKKPQPDFLEILKDSEFKDSGFNWTREQRNAIARRPGVVFLLQRGQYSFGWDEAYKAAHPQIEVFRTS